MISFFIDGLWMAHTVSDLVKTCLKFWTLCMNIRPESEMQELCGIIQFPPYFHSSNLAKHIVTGSHFHIFSFCFCHAFLNLGTSSWKKSEFSAKEDTQAKWAHNWSTLWVIADQWSRMIPQIVLFFLFYFLYQAGYKCIECERSWSGLRHLKVWWPTNEHPDVESHPPLWPQSTRKNIKGYRSNIAV